jgi:uncharacterized protein (DUF1499 family)
VLLKTLFLIASMGMIVTGCTGVRPSNLGVRDGKLAPCPFTPNCVSSQSSDREHAVEPLRYSAASREAMAKLKTIIREMPRAVMVTEMENYLHVEFTSLIFRFVDDVEFSLDDTAKLIHVRSASRLGKSDLGVNRKRVEAIRKAWESKL